MSKKTFASVWDAIEDTPAEAQNMRLRSALMMGLQQHIKAQGWTQAEAARRCGVTQPRMNDMLRGRIGRFSLDALVNMAAGCGQQVHIELAAA